MARQLIFFVGTTAELIKVMPVLRLLGERKSPFQIVLSGQNDLSASELWPLAGLSGPHVVLSHDAIPQSPSGLMAWFVRMLVRAPRRLSKEFSSLADSLVVVHGDTVSTLLGAISAKRLGAKLGHIEAGLRSFRWLRPFPEEICRVAVSELADIAFCPNAWAAGHLRYKPELKIINTEQNTLYDSLQLALTHPVRSSRSERYFVCVLHRQENLLDRELVREVLTAVIDESKRRRCVFVLHPPTEAALERSGALFRLRQATEIELVPRLAYLEFVHLLRGADFIVTDGGSNQEEATYLGKPCLVLREETERTEGQNENVVLMKRDRLALPRFFLEFECYQRPPLVATHSPSAIIADELDAWLLQHG